MGLNFGQLKSSGVGEGVGGWGGEGVGLSLKENSLVVWGWDALFLSTDIHTQDRLD